MAALVAVVVVKVVLEGAAPGGAPLLALPCVCACVLCAVRPYEPRASLLCTAATAAEGTEGGLAPMGRALQCTAPAAAPRPLPLPLLLL